MACYPASLMSCILIVFQLTTNFPVDIRFNLNDDDDDGVEYATMMLKKVFVIAGFFLAFTMHIFRFNALMSSGQRFGDVINEATPVLDRYEIISESKLSLTQTYIKKLSQLQKRLDIYQSKHPISPYSIFDLNLKTFYSTLAALLTYVMTLIKISGFKPPDTDDYTERVPSSCNFTDVFAIII